MDLRKKWLIAVLAILFIAGTGFAGAGAEKPAGPVKLTLGVGSGASSADDKYWPYDVVSELQRITKIEISLIYLNDDALKVRLAGNDLPDMLQTGPTYFKQLIEGNQVIALDSLIASRGKNITASFPLRIEFAKKFYSNGTGKIYFLPTKAGPAGWERRIGTGGYVTRWDFYKEMGYPSFKNDDEYLAMLVAMNKAHPKTASGKPIYGMGFFTDWGIWAWHFKSATNDGLQPVNNVFGNGYVSSVDTNTIYNNYTDPANSAFWRGVRFANKAYNLGLVDPDSFTMNLEAYEAKCKEGLYLSASNDWWLSEAWDNLGGKASPQTMEGYVLPLPMDGDHLAYNYGSQVGNVAASWCVTTNCKTPDRAIDLLNFTFSTDGARLFFGGIKGTHWDYYDGVPKLKPEFVAITVKGGDGWLKTGVWSAVAGSLSGLNLGVKHPDGGLVGIINSPDVWAARNDLGFNDFCTYYKIKFPSEIFQNRVKEGKMFDYSKYLPDIAAAMPLVPDDVKRIDAKLDEIILKAIPRVVQAKSDAEFLSVQQSVIKDLKDSGADTAWTWWQTEFNKAKAFVTKK